MKNIKTKILVGIAMTISFVSVSNGYETDPGFMYSNVNTSKLYFYNSTTETSTDVTAKYTHFRYLGRYGDKTFLIPNTGNGYYVYNETTSTLSLKDSANNYFYWGVPVMESDDNGFGYISYQKTSGNVGRMAKINLSTLAQTEIDLGCSFQPEFYKIYQNKIYYRCYNVNTLMSYDLSNGNTSPILVTNAKLARLNAAWAIQEGKNVRYVDSSALKMYVLDMTNGSFSTEQTISLPSGSFLGFVKDRSGNYFFANFTNGIYKVTNLSTFAYTLKVSGTNTLNYIREVEYNKNASCTDSILNQDEVYSTEHPYDYGGICGTCNDGIQQTDVTNPEVAIDYGGRCTKATEYRFDGCTPRTIKYYGTGAISSYNMGGLSNYSLFVDDVSNESEWLKIFGLGQSKIEQYTFDDGTGLNYDLFKVYNIQYSNSTNEQNNPQVKSGSLVVTSGGPLSAIKTDTTTGTPPSIEIYSMRSGVVRKFDFVRFTGANYPTITKGSQQNYAGYVTWNTQNGIISSPLVLSGGIATSYLSDGLLADSAIINLQQQNSKFNGVYFQFSGFSFGLAGGSLSVTECGNGDFKCKMYVESPTASPVCKPDSNSVLGIGEACVYTTAFTTPVVVNDAGDITTVSGNACIPNRKQGTVVTPDGFKVDYVVDQSGSVIQQNTRPISTGDFTEQCLSSDAGILEYVKCSFQFVGNQIKQLTTTTEKTTDIINKAQTGVKPNETKTGSLELGQSQKQNTGNSLVNAVQNQYDAYDNGTDAFANVGTLMKWVLGAILTFVVILLFFALSGNRKQ